MEESLRRGITWEELDVRAWEDAMVTHVIHEGTLPDLEVPLLDCVGKRSPVLCDHQHPMVAIVVRQRPEIIYAGYPEAGLFHCPICDQTRRVTFTLSPR